MSPIQERNPGTPIDLDWVMDARVNRSAVERRAATLTGRRTVQEGLAGCLAAAGHYLYRSHHAGGR